MTDDKHIVEMIARCLMLAMDQDELIDGLDKKTNTDMKIIITENSVEMIGADFEVDHDNMIDWSCRLSALEGCAWGVKRLGEEMQKSVSFYRTGKPVDNIGIE